MCLLLSARVPVEHLRMGNGRGEQVTTEMKGLEEPPGALHRAASLQGQPLVPPTESETGRSRPSPIPPRESSSLVSSLEMNSCRILFYRVWFVNVVPNVLLGNTSPRAISRAERERKVSMRLHRGAPANVSSSDLTARHDQSRISTSQVKFETDEPMVWMRRLSPSSVILWFKTFWFLL